MPSATEAFPLNETAIYQVLEESPLEDPGQIRELLAKAREMKGLEDQDLPLLMGIQDPQLLQELFDAARWVKNQIYGKRIVLFAPLYTSNECENDCLYCAFRSSNRALPRRTLNQNEIAAEVRCLLAQGHKRVLLLGGEDDRPESFDYLLSAIRTVYEVRQGKDSIRRVNVNNAPLSVENFRRLREAEIGTYQLFQETYHRETYEKMHPAGPKANYDWRLETMDRAMQAGVEDVGIGPLFGLFDWRFELLATMQHAHHLESRFGCGPHSISIPRIEPAAGSTTSQAPPCAVSDEDYKKIIAIIRLAVPYTGLILSTRERPEVRREIMNLGISQISAGSRTNPGGYQENAAEDLSQPSLGDHRTLDEVVRELVEMGLLPSFCSSCYSLGRTGSDFMDVAKPGEIKAHCNPNALSSLQEYLEDHASPLTRCLAEQLMARSFWEMEAPVRDLADHMMVRVKRGERDVLC